MQARFASIVVAFLAAGLLSASADASLLLYYSYDAPDTTADALATDHSGNGLDGTLNTGGSGTYSYVSDVPAAIGSGQSVRLAENATNSGARVRRSISTSTLNYNTDNWSFATWFKRADADNNDMIFHLGNGDGFGTDNELYIYASGGATNIALQHYYGSGLTTINYSSPADSALAGSWHHVALVRDGSDMRLYLDGSLIHTDTSFSLNMSTSTPISFGGVGGDFSYDRNLDGWLDDTAMWTSVLTADQIASLAQGVSPTAIPEPATLSLAALALATLRRRSR